MIAWFDLASGVAGDMILAALADAGDALGADAAGAMTEAVAALGLGCELTFERGESGGLSCLRARVAGGDRPVGPDGLREAIGRCAEPVRSKALRGLERLVEAEAAVHGTSPGEVHLHELGAADTAADLAGAAAGMYALRIDRVAAAPVPLPHGWTSTAHGPIPLPGPAVLELLRDRRVTHSPTGVETVTPTGVAVLLAHDAEFGPLPPMTLRATGTGAGTVELDRPNVCRVLVGEPAELPTDLVVLLEANIDDQTPEALGHAVEILLGAGALDVWLTPVVMKRSRPGLVLSALVEPQLEQELVRTAFRQTSTLGLRRREVQRHVLPRETVTVTVAGRPVRVKLGRLDGEVVTVSPEFTDCAAVADESGISLDEVYAEARLAVRERA